MREFFHEGFSVLVGMWWEKLSHEGLNFMWWDKLSHEGLMLMWWDKLSHEGLVFWWDKPTNLRLSKGIDIHEY